MYQRLIAYKKKYGTTSVPHGWKEDPQLANWVMNQHVAYSKCKLSQEWIDLLESIGFVSWDPIGHQWMETYQRLITYEKKYGTTHVLWG